MYYCTKKKKQSIAHNKINIKVKLLMRKVNTQWITIIK
jgi:hypothetical protein